MLYREVTTLAGSGTLGSTDGIATSATFNGPRGVAVDALGNVYVGDSENNKIRKIAPSGTVTTMAGSGAAGSSDGIGSAASFYFPSDITVDASGNLYVADSGNNKIRKITPSGTVTTLAGSGAAGSADGTGSAASFSTPYGVEIDISGNVYVGDFGSNKIRKITPLGVVTTIAGSGTVGSTDGTSLTATFNGPRGVAIDASGNVYVGDSTNNKIRKITPSGTVTTLAGSGAVGSTDGTGTSASFNSPRRVAADAEGNVYVADTNNSKIRKITPLGEVSSLAGSGIIGSTDGIGSMASFNLPRSVAVDALRNVYVGDANNNKIRKITQQGYAISPNLPAGLNIDGTGTISGTPTEITGLTTYTITAYNTAGSSTTTLVLSTTTLGITEFSTTSLKLYPNPAHSLLNIQTSNNVVLDKIIITDLMGKTVLEQTQNTNQVSVDKLATGVYILNGYSEGGTFQEKFIIE
jgi:streptogramin lyase